MSRPHLPKVMEKLVPVHQRRTGEIAASVPGRRPAPWQRDQRAAGVSGVAARLGDAASRPFQRHVSAVSAMFSTVGCWYKPFT